MAYNVNLDFVTGMVTLNGKEIPMGGFNPSNELETEVSKIIDKFYTPVYVQQMNIEFDDVTELVKSDMFKGDNHSQELLGGTN